MNPEKTTYFGAQQKVLVIIGDKAEQVKSRAKMVADEMKGRAGAPEIVGLRVSLNHDSYEMYLEGEEIPLFFVCDRVAKCIKKDLYGRFETAQVCVFDDESYEHIEKKPRAKV